MSKKRFNLVIPDDVHNQLEVLAEQEGLSVTDLIRKFINLGVLAYETQNDPDTQLIIKREGVKREVLLL